MKKIEIAYILPSVVTNGGVAVVFRHIYELRNRGREAVIFSQADENDPSWHNLGEHIPVYTLSRYNELCGEQGPKYLVATWWETAFDIVDLPALNKLYFVQSLEHRFYPESDVAREYFFLSLYLGHFIFTEADWISRWCRDELNITVPVAPNGIDPDVFFPEKNAREKLKPRPRILIEGPAAFGFKGVADCFEAVKGLDAEIWYVNTLGEPQDTWKFDKYFYRVPFGEMRSIYSDCDILLKMSKVEGVFGPPMEMMACGGVPVVGNVSGYDQYCVHEKNCLVVDMNSPLEAKAALERLVQDPELYSKLRDGALGTIPELGWSATGDILDQGVFPEELPDQRPDPKLYAEKSAALRIKVNAIQSELYSPNLIRAKKILGLLSKIKSLFTGGGG